MACVGFLAMAASQVVSGPDAEILRSGKDSIGPKGLLSTEKWPSGFSFPKKEGRYTVVRLDDGAYQAPREEDLRTWDPAHFTDVRELPVGTRLKHFNFIVCAWENEALTGAREHKAKGAGTGFDQFVRTHLNAEAPQGPDVVAVSPYFFHKKTVVSASVISQNLTAMFGNMGFGLGVPLPNFVASAPSDMGAPVDFHFYTRGALHPTSPYGSLGAARMAATVAQYGFLPLNKMLPSKERPITGVCRLHPFAGPKDKRAHEAAEAYIKGKARAEVERLVRKSPTSLLAEKMSATFMGGFQLPVSWYNEVVLSPSRTISGVTTAITLNFAFFRTSREKLASLQESPYGKALMQVAEVFDLPVVFIEDDREYNGIIETDGMDSLFKA